MSRRKNQHVVPNGSEWAVKGFGNSKYTAVTKTKGEAVKIGRKIAMNQKSQLFIHRKNGAIEKRNSYGGNLYPQNDEF